ncbi:MAG: MBL fold hydrolase [Candidatus Yanofskybacteria bacterium CG10_big_fil_rev_8_21_14_0_10_36_16]|uniref:MBL fold hydrolase n=1 Tax=Candidatus Yanofskybacteria bacterium CG10_big_fil_rev_8_21_14_0_10_36_16 TaxID=1975096 RepID=A0A2J0QB89_9BACT|nr:MAG: MBL fold hydrolase [Candidatus Yanofskybacteria bacterium CG10_big_fil_rev_8_21_14_0_10_36_16]
MKLSFFGGAGQVTGANYLLETDSGQKIVIDCGLSQGSKYAEDFNYADFSYDPSQVDFVFITHSHIDHMGRLPKLYKDGFRGKIYANTPAKDLMTASLPDSLSHIEREAKEDGHPPLYEGKDIKGMLELVQSLDFHEKVDLQGDVEAQLHDAGHILGSSIIEIKWKEGEKYKRIYFSGDLGNPPTPFLNPTELVRNADYVVIESAYGDRVHEDRELRKGKLEDAVENTVKEGGALIIPSFAVERTQELLFELNELIENKRIPRIPVFVDSPLAIKITEVYRKYQKNFNKQASELIESGDDIFHFPGLKMTRTVNESKSINEVPPPKIIIAGSGMSVGGRILHHERKYLPDPKSTMLFVGYQVIGTLGRAILEIKDKRKVGKKSNSVRIFGNEIPVNCNIVAIGGYSAHADQLGLLRWVKAANSYLESDESCSNETTQRQNEQNKDEGEHRLKKVFVVQGEREVSEVLASKIKDILVVDAVVPKDGDSYEL